MARRRSGGFVRGPRRATDWSASTILGAPLFVANNSASLVEVFTPIVGGETLIRTRGMLGFQSDQAAADEFQLGAYGIAVVTEQAATIGITAVPTPATDAAWGGWLYHTYFFAGMDFISAVGVEPGMMHTFPIDSKAMRKVDEDERLVTVVENTGIHAFELASAVRLLSKVH